MNTLDKILEGLTEQQKEVVKSINGKHVCLATAGAGKTHTMIKRAMYMIESGIPAKNILMFTFTRKAAEEMKSRVEAQIGSQAKGMTVCTYHSFCVKLLRKYANVIGFNRNFTIYDEEDKATLIKHLLESLKESDKVPEYSESDIISIISSWKGSMLSPLEVDDSEYPGMKEFYQLYVLKMRESNAFDFDDLQYMAIKILESNETVRKEVQNTYKYVTFDEMQDSRADSDLRLIELICGPDDSMWNLMGTGDIDQSIYSFRGANVSVIMQFIQKHKMNILNMGRNFRSTKTIVEASDSLVKHNQIRIDKEVYSENEQGHPVTFVTVNDEEREAKTVVNLILSSKRAGWQYKDIAVLYRMSRLSRAVEKELLKNSIPYHMVSGVSFYARQEVKDLMAYARLVYNPNDQEAFRRIANIPKRSIGATTIDAVFDYMTEHTQYSVLLACKNISVKQARTRKGLDNFVSVIEELEYNVDQGQDNEQYTMADFVQRVIALTNYREYLNETCKNQEETSQRNGNVDELIRIASTYNNLADFIEGMMSHVDEVEEDNDKVNLLTIHGSKGLEWPIVIVIGCNEGTLPSALSIMDGNIEEERRLTYVAMTRAKKQLVMLRAKYVLNHRFVPTVAKESRFIKEVDSQYVVRR